MGNRINITVLLFILVIHGCAVTAPTGLSVESSEPHIDIHIVRGDHSTQISFQGDTVLAEKDMMFDVIDKIQTIHSDNRQWRAKHNSKD